MGEVRAHASYDAPAVDVAINDTKAITDLAYPISSGYAELDSGPVTVKVTPAGVSTPVVIDAELTLEENNDVVVRFNPIPVENGKVYTVVAHGTLDANDDFPFSVRVFIDNDSGDGFADLSVLQLASVLVVHASPDAPGVDLLVDDQLAAANPEFPENTGYLEVPAGTRNVKVNVNSTSTSVIEANLDLSPDGAYTVFAVDSVSNITALVLQDDLTAPASGNAHARFVHLSPNAPAVDITLTDGAIVFGNTSFKENTGFMPLPVNTYDLQVRLAGTDTVVLNLHGITLENGKIYTVFAKGFVGGSGHQALGAEIIVNN